MAGLADVSAALGNATRARMLDELLGGRPLPAGALAARVGVAPSTATGHLARLERAGLIRVTTRGRRREVELAGPEVAEALEALCRVTGDADPPVGLRAVNRREALRDARSCYDHLAGQLGVALADGLLRVGALAERDGAFVVPAGAAAHYREVFGVDLDGLAGRRPLTRVCIDWTERRPHVAGALGAALLTSMLQRGWLARRAGDRALTVMPRGRDALAQYVPGCRTA